MDPSKQGAKRKQTTLLPTTEQSVCLLYRYGTFLKESKMVEKNQKWSVTTLGGQADHFRGNSRYFIGSPQIDTYGDEEIKQLLGHYSTLYSYLGGTPDKVQREWLPLKRFVMKEESLSSLSYSELYRRLFDQKSTKANDQDFYHVLLLAAIIGCLAVDTSVCERGFSLMNNLKSVRRSGMRDELLRILMIICSLGEEWNDTAKTPVDRTVEVRREQSSHDRYEATMWKEAGLTEHSAQLCGPGGLGRVVVQCESGVPVVPKSKSWGHGRIKKGCDHFR